MLSPAWTKASSWHNAACGTCLGVKSEVFQHVLNRVKEPSPAGSWPCPCYGSPGAHQFFFAISCSWLMAASSPGSLCLLQRCILDPAPACIDLWALLVPDTGLCTLFLLNFIRFLQAIKSRVNGHPFPPAYWLLLSTYHGHQNCWAGVQSSRLSIRN